MNDIQKSTTVTQAQQPVGSMPQTPAANQDPHIGAYPNAPQSANVSGGEMFVGLNLISKIGVIFIVIGMIAFTAVSEDYLSGEIRGGLMYFVGALLAAAGEFFYRKKSAVFARALTMGALLEWAVSVPVSYYSLNAFGCIGAIVGAALTAALGIVLAVRYNSRMLLSTALVCAIPPFFAEADARLGLILGAAILLLTLAGACFTSYKKDWTSTGWTALCYAVFLTIAVRVCVENVFRGQLNIIALVSLIFTLTAFLLCALECTARCVRSCGEMKAAEVAKLLFALILSILFALVFLWNDFSRQTGGAAVICLAALALICAVGSALRYKGSRLTAAFSNTALAAVVLGLFALCSLRWFVIALCVYGAALTVAGLFLDRKQLRVWGYSVLGTAEFLFIWIALIYNSREIFPLQFGVNAAVYMAIMICYAVKKHKSALFSTYCALTIFKAGFFGVSMLYRYLAQASEFGYDWAGMMSGKFFAAAFSAVLWFALGFAAGKLRFMEKGANISALCLYFLGLCWLLSANIQSEIATPNNAAAIILVVLINLVSVASVLDAIKNIESLSGKATRSCILIVSLYGLFTMTMVLSINNWVSFTSCIISIAYLLTAAAWIVYGFLRERPLTRRFGLGLSLLSAAKLFLLDFAGIDAMWRTLMFIGFGITLLCISLIYGYFEHKTKKP